MATASVDVPTWTGAALHFVSPNCVVFAGRYYNQSGQEVSQGISRSKVKELGKQARNSCGLSGLAATAGEEPCSNLYD
jgi:hypothetical protein